MGGDVYSLAIEKARAARLRQLWGSCIFAVSDTILMIVNTLQNLRLRPLILILVSFFLSPISAFSQDTTKVSIKEENGQFYYEDVINIPNTSKEELFKKSKQWITATLKTADQNISADETSMQIINSGALTIDPKKNSAAFLISQGDFDFKIQLNFRENRYKIKIDNLMIHTLMHVGYRSETKNRSYSELKDNKEGRYIKDQINEKLTAMVRSLNSTLKSNNSEKDW